MIRVPDKNNVVRRLIVKRVILCTITISVFAFLACSSSRHADSLLPHSFSVCFSTALFSAISGAFERRFMFLVCNGILAVLARSSPILPDHEHDNLACVDFERGSTGDESETLPNSTGVAPLEDEGPERQQGEEPDPQRTSSALAGTKEDKAETEEEEEEQEEEESIGNSDAREGVEASAVEDVTTEELNRRIEEFIRKMRAEIQIEARGQLTAT